MTVRARTSSWWSRSSRPRSERGSAIVEFHALGLVLLIPLVYVLLAALDVQRATYGVTHAAREAGRVYVSGGDERAARIAANVALTDQGVTPGDVAVSFACVATPCRSPGAEITVTVSTSVPLPFLPDMFADAARARIPVQAVHVGVVDRFREFGPAGAS